MHAHLVGVKVGSRGRVLNVLRRQADACSKLDAAAVQFKHQVRCSGVGRRVQLFMAVRRVSAAARCWATAAGNRAAQCSKCC